MRNWFDFGGVNTADHDMLIIEKTPFSSPTPDVTALETPGRSGDIIIDTGRRKNVKVGYTCAILARKDETFDQAAARVRAAFLAGDVRYKKLVDSTDADHFRQAALLEAIAIEKNGTQDGEAKFVFSCKPWRYSFAGCKPLALQNGMALYNYERFSSDPVITINGSGKITLNVNGKSFEVSDVSGTLRIDSEKMTASMDGVPCSAKVNCQAFPVLLPGKNVINWDGNVSAVSIEPNWRTL